MLVSAKAFLPQPVIFGSMGRVLGRAPSTPRLRDQVVDTLIHLSRAVRTINRN